MKKIQEKKGITLIALIITIIVLLILAGITVGTLTTNNSVLNQSKEAKNKTNYESELEKVKIAVMAVASQNATTLTGEITKTELDNELKKQFGDEKISFGPKPWAYIGKYGVYGINENGEVTGSKKTRDDIKVVFVHNKVYQYVEGWTWEEWVNSEYNIDGFTCSTYFLPSSLSVNGVVGFGNAIFKTNDPEGQIVYSTDLIDSNLIYIFSQW